MIFIVLNGARVSIHRTPHFARSSALRRTRTVDVDEVRAAFDEIIAEAGEIFVTSYQ
jgi:hypothetical protein